MDRPAPRAEEPATPDTTQEMPPAQPPLRTMYRSAEGRRQGRRVAGKGRNGDVPKDEGTESRPGRRADRDNGSPAGERGRRANRQPPGPAEPPTPPRATPPASGAGAPAPPRWAPTSPAPTAPPAATTPPAPTPTATTPPGPSPAEEAAEPAAATRRTRHDERKRQEARERLEARNRRRPEPAPPRRPLDGPPAKPEDPEESSTGAAPRWRSRGRALMGFLTRTLWLSLLAASLGAVVLPWLVPETSEKVALAGAVGITALFTHGLAVRSGGRPLMSLGLALVLTSTAAVSGMEVLLAGATVATVVVTAILAVLATTPSAAFPGVIREVAIAAAVGVVGAFGAHAWGADVSLDRTTYMAIGLSLIGALALVYRLGAGFHGLGRRGFVMIISGVGLLTVTLAYTAALAQWGSPALIERTDEIIESVRDALGAVPRPIEVLLGFPALAWGVSTRARRRQGWWVCAFGAPGMSVLAVSLLDPAATLLEVALTIAYSLVLGLLVGYLVIRADLYLTGARGRRARRLEEMAAHRPEPGRFQPLL